MCAGMIDMKKALTKIMELEEELKSTCDGYEEEITILMEKNDDLKKKLKVFMGFPVTRGEDDDCTCPENYIIIDDTDSDPDIAMMTMLMKLEQISWSPQRSSFSSRPP